MYLFQYLFTCLFLIAAVNSSSVISLFLLICAAFFFPTPEPSPSLIYVDLAIDSCGFGDAIPHFTGTEKEQHAWRLVTNTHYWSFCGYSGSLCSTSTGVATSTVSCVAANSLLWSDSLLLTKGGMVPRVIQSFDYKVKPLLCKTSKQKKKKTQLTSN